VELVVGFSPGGGVDRTARTVERILVANKLVSAPITVVNKPGAGGAVAFAYVSQRPADGHTLLIAGQGLLTNHIMGTSPLNYTDFTPIASLFNEYSVLSVNAASPLRTGKDLAERLKKDSKSVTLGYAAVGAGSHIAAALFWKLVGGSAKELRGVVYKSGADAVVSVLGGHIDVATSTAGSVAPHVGSGVRVLGVGAPTRLGGALAGVPTWKEQGIDLVFGPWRAILGPRGLTPAQVAYWEGALRKATQHPEWKDDIEKNLWSDDFVTGAQFRKDLDKDYADLKSVLVDLGLAKQ
jgi:putative tricarboxylic transport membrane protein